MVLPPYKSLIGLYLARLAPDRHRGLFDLCRKDTVRTFYMAAELGPEALGAYVISMATSASDVLAVKLLQVLCFTLVRTSTRCPTSNYPVD